MIRLLLLRKDRFLVKPIISMRMGSWSDVHYSYTIDIYSFRDRISAYSDNLSVICNIVLENNKLQLRIEDVNSD